MDEQYKKHCETLRTFNVTDGSNGEELLPDALDAFAYECIRIVELSGGLL